MASTLINLPKALVDEDGGAFGFVCIWRAGDKGDSARRCTVGEWLSDPHNQSGVWLIDGGWGGPPGPIHVAWNAKDNAWVNGGYCGTLFNSRH